MADSPPVFVITGQLAAGKSTLARALLQRFQRGYHIGVDGIREMVVSGLASPLEWTDETERQFGLAIRGAAALTRIYADAGFAVVIEGGLDPEQVEGALNEAGLRDRMVGMILHPPIDVALERNRQRRTKDFDTSILEGVMREIDADLASEGQRDGWYRLDSGTQTVDDTVREVLDLLSRR